MVRTAVINKKRTTTRKPSTQGSNQSSSVSQTILDKFIESEERYRDMFDNAPIGYVATRSRHIVAANPKAADILGYTVDELVGRPLGDLFPDPEALDQISDQRAQEFESGIPSWNDERLMKRKDGSQFPGRFSGRLVVLPSGERIGLTTFVDVSEEKATEEALRQSEERYHHLFEHAPFSYIASESGTITSANPQAAKTLGYSIEEIIGLPIMDLFPDKEQSEIRRTQRLQEFEAGIDEWEDERLMVRKDGVILQVRYKGQISLAPDGSLLGLGTFIDVTRERETEHQLQQSEARYQAIYENLDYGVVRQNLDGYILDVNPAVEELTGYSRDELLSMHTNDLVENMSDQRGAEHRKQVVDGGKVPPGEIEIKKKDGTLYPVEIRRNLLTDADGNPESLIVLARDLRSEREAQIASREIAVLDERNRFASEMHDTVAQSLTMLTAQLDIIASTLPPELVETKQQVELAKQLARTSLSQTRSALQDLKPSELHPGGLVAAIQLEVAGLEANGIETDVQCRGVEPIELAEKNATAVYRIVQESLSNCLKHSNATQVKVDVLFGDQDIVFEIVDNGVGFDPHKPKANNFTGFGLGVMDQRTRAVGGEITVISSPGTGVRVIGRVPVSKPEHHTHGGMRSLVPEVEAVEPLPDAAPCRVILVDDHELVRTGIKSLLNDVPEVVVVGETGTGESVVLLAQECEPDVVLMDVNLPTKDGIAVTRELLEVMPKCKVILLTVYDDDDHVREGFRAGAMGYMIKGASKNEIVSGIQTVFAGGSLIPSTSIQHLTAPPRATQLPALTDRELQVFQALCDGGTNKEIGEMLFLSINTVNFHLRNIYQKLGVKSRTQAIKVGTRVGLLERRGELAGVV